jgi:hypothetical protein
MGTAGISPVVAVRKDHRVSDISFPPVRDATSLQHCCNSRGGVIEEIFVSIA